MTTRHLPHTSGLGFDPRGGVRSVAVNLLGTWHYAGRLWNTRGPPGIRPPSQNLSEMIARLAELPLAAEPGTVCQYSVDYDVMGLIIERVSGKSRWKHISGNRYSNP